MNRKTSKTTTTTTTPVNGESTSSGANQASNNNNKNYVSLSDVLNQEKPSTGTQLSQPQQTGSKSSLTLNAIVSSAFQSLLPKSGSSSSSSGGGKKVTFVPTLTTSPVKQQAAPVVGPDLLTVQQLFEDLKLDCDEHIKQLDHIEHRRKEHSLTQKRLLMELFAENVHNFQVAAIKSRLRANSNLKLKQQHPHKHQCNCNRFNRWRKLFSAGRRNVGTKFSRLRRRSFSSTGFVSKHLLTANVNLVYLLRKKLYKSLLTRSNGKRERIFTIKLRRDLHDLNELRRLVRLCTYGKLSRAKNAPANRNGNTTAAKVRASSAGYNLPKIKMNDKSFELVDESFFTTLNNSRAKTATTTATATTTTTNTFDDIVQSFSNRNSDSLLTTSLQTTSDDGCKLVKSVDNTSEYSSTSSTSPFASSLLLRRKKELGSIQPSDVSLF